MSEEYHEMSETEVVEEAINEILAEVERLRELANEGKNKLRDTSYKDEGTTPARREIEELFAPSFVKLQMLYGIISTGRGINYQCQMPNNPSHVHHQVYICTKDPSHKFCRYHQLRNCPIQTCGGNLI